MSKPHPTSQNREVEGGRREVKKTPPHILPPPSQEKKWLPKLIAWEVTRSCNLDCIHCRAAARFGPYPNELKTEECLAFLDDVAKAFPSFIIILTGGEPMKIGSAH